MSDKKEWREFWLDPRIAGDLVFTKGTVLGHEKRKDQPMPDWAIHAIDYRAFNFVSLELEELHAKYNFAVGSAQQNAKERDAALKALDDLQAALTARDEVIREMVEQLQHMRNYFQGLSSQRGDIDIIDEADRILAKAKAFGEKP